MTELIRKQVREILDEDRRVNERVYQREKEQVKVFNESVLPKKERDIDTEVSVERDVEKFNAFLETKINNLEIIIKRRLVGGPTTPIPSASSSGTTATPTPSASTAVEEEADEEGAIESKEPEIVEEVAPKVKKEKSKGKKGKGKPLKGGAGKDKYSITLGLSEYQKQLDDVLRTGDGLIMWNNMSRLANRQDISNTTRSQIITKIMESQNLIDGVVYGYKTLIDNFIGSGYQNPYLSRALPKLISAYALYATIQRQLFTNSIKPITLGDIEVAVRDVISDFPPIVRNKIDELLAETDPTKSILLDKSKKEAYLKRIKILEEDKGAKLSPEELRKVAKVFVGYVPETSYIDPALQAILDEQARKESETKAEIERRPTPIIPLEIAPPVYYQTNPELIGRVSEDIRKDGLNKIEKLNRDLLSSPLLDTNIDKPDPPNLDSIIDDFIALYVDITQQYRTIEGMPPMSDADITDDFEANYPNVFDRQRSFDAGYAVNVRKNVRNRFVKQFRSAISEIIKMYRTIVLAESKVKEEETLERLSKPNISGYGRPRFGRLGLGFDDRRNEMYDY